MTNIVAMNQTPAPTAITAEATSALNAMLCWRAVRPGEAYTDATSATR